tara:strand:- start:511 stop:1356 length:846 start_codon:yes stop_codon:yes gene_type:complete
MKIGIGTVQWGKDYGIANNNGVTSDREINKIISCAQVNQINILDTAIQYGSAHKKIGKYCNDTLRIVTKLVADSKDSIRKQLNISLQDLNRKSIYACLIHDSNFITKNDYKWKELEDLKLSGKLKKIGYSLYTINQLKVLLDKGIIPDIIQVPYNCINREFDKYFKILKKLDVEIHVRSVFYQGLFFLDSNKIPDKLSFFNERIYELKKIAEGENLKIDELALLFVNNNKFIDYFILGFDNELQLLNALNTLKTKKIRKEIVQSINSMTEIDNKLLNPSNW